MYLFTYLFIYFSPLTLGNIPGPNKPPELISMHICMPPFANANESEFDFEKYIT